MATLTLAQSPAGASLSSDRAEPIETDVLDGDGLTLCRAVVALVSDEGIVELSNVDAPEQLLSYYFGHGGRKVLLSLHDDLVEGWLETRWATIARRWWLELG